MPEEDLTQIAVGRFRVGISGLHQAFEAVKGLLGQPDSNIAEALFNRLKSINYIPKGAREEYKQAFLREYKKALGEQVAEEPGGLIVKIIGPGCQCCDRLEQTLMAVLAELNLPAVIEYVRDPKAIQALGVLRPPALLIGNDLRAMGWVPSQDQLKNWLRDATGQA